MNRYLLAAGSLATLLILAWVYRAGHSAGFDKRDSTVEDEIRSELEAREEKFEQDWLDYVAALEPEIIVEEKIVERIREVEIKVPQVIERIIPECRDLGPDYGGLLDEHVAAANGREAPADPAVVVD